MRQEMLAVIHQFQGSNENRESNVSSGAQQTERALEQTNDKIDSIQQRFAQFQELFLQHQKEFAESFKHLDDRQKLYIDQVNDMLSNAKMNVKPAESIVSVDVASDDDQSSNDDVICVPVAKGGLFFPLSLCLGQEINRTFLLQEQKLKLTKNHRQTQI